VSPGSAATHAPWRGPTAWADLVPLLGAVAVAISVSRGFALRLDHPFDLEWMEGGMLAHAWRLTHGLPLYPEAGPEWIPYVYPPGYTAVIAALSTMTGLDYPVGRGVAIAGTFLAVAALVAMFARRGHPAVGVVVAGCFLGCWRASGAFYDLVRPDGLAIGLLACAVAVALERRRWAPIVAGVLLCLAFVVKHHSAAFGVPLMLGLWLREGRTAALTFAAASAIPAGLFTLVATVTTSGRFLEYLLVVPATHPIIAGRILPGTPGELGSWLLPAVVAGAAWLLIELRRLRPELPWPALLGLPVVCGVGGAAWVAADPVVPGVAMPPVPVLAATAACIGAGLGAGLVHGLATAADRAARASGPADAAANARWWTAWLLGSTALGVATWMRGHNGGFLNVLMPAHLAICVGMGLAVVGLRHRWPGALMAVATALGMTTQVAWIGAQLEVDDVLPTAEDRAAGELIVARLEECPDGPILSPHAAWLPVQAGRAPSPHLIAIWDIRYEDGPFFDGIGRLADAAKAHRWSCVVKGGRQPIGFQLEQNYHVVESFRIPPRALIPKTGWRVRPSELLVPGVSSGGPTPGPPEPRRPGAPASSREEP
jgi:hypothetical protein